MKNLALQSEEIQARMAIILDKDNRTDPTINEDLEALLAIATDTHNELVEGYCCAHLASYCYMHENNQRKLNEYLRRAFALTQENGDDEEFSFVCNLMAIDAANNGIYPLALDSYLMGLAHSNGNVHRQANLLSNAGGIYWRLSDYESAIDYTKRALDLNRTFDRELDRLNEVIFTSQLIFCQVRAGQLKEAAASIRDIDRVLIENPAPEILEEPSPYGAKVWYYDACGDASAAAAALDRYIELLQQFDSRMDFLEDAVVLGNHLIARGQLSRIPALMELFDEEIQACSIPNFQLLYLAFVLRYAETVNDQELFQSRSADFYHISVGKHARDLENEYYNVQLRKEIDALQARQREVECENLRLIQAATTDPLTGLANRSLLNQKAEQLFDAAKESGGYFGVSMLDVDFFKEYNDTYGHQAGDEVLQRIAGRIHALENEHLFAARYGGDEFMLIYSGLTDEEVLSIANRLRDEIADMNIPHEKSTVSDRITISQGIRNSLVDPDNRFWDYTYTADQAVYDVKRTHKGGITLLSRMQIDQRALSDAKH